MVLTVKNSDQEKEVRLLHILMTLMSVNSFRSDSSLHLLNDHEFRYRNCKSLDQSQSPMFSRKVVKLSHINTQKKNSQIYDFY